MAKGSSGNKNLLRISGILFGFIGMFHLLRSQGIDIRFMELTRLGSVIYGGLILLLSIACFYSSRN